MKKMTKTAMCILGAFIIFFVWCCHKTMIELPYQTWFDQVPLADLLYTRQLRISNLFSRFGEHGMLANNCIYLINVYFFHGSTLFDVILNDINAIVCGIVFVHVTYEICDDRRWAGVIMAAECVFLFGTMQGSAGAMETQVRLGILFFTITMFYLDKMFRKEQISTKETVCAVLLIFASINVFGTLYSFAGVPFVWFIIAFYIVIYKRKDIHHWVIGCAYVLSIPLYLVEYHGINTGGGTGFSFSMVNFVKGIFAWCANGALGWAFHESSLYRDANYLAAGLFVFLLICISVFLFFKKEMYTVTWFPLMNIVYSFGVYVMVYIGRANSWEWFANEWYCVQIKMAIAGAIMIYGWFFYHIKNKGRILITGGVLLIVALGFLGNYMTVKRVSSVRAYYFQKQKYLFISNKNDMPVDENGMTPLLQSLDTTMNCIEILKKYNLSVYQYWDAYKACPTTRLDENEIRYISGHFDDGWIEKEFVFKTAVADDGMIEIICTAPTEQEVDIYINDIKTDTARLNEGTNKFSIACGQTGESTIRLISNYAGKLDYPDQRMASYHLEDILIDTQK